jgi:hypothetical protein
MAWAGWHAYTHHAQSPHNDLRNRVVGSRLQMAGLSPYTHQWKNGDPETLLDPFERPEWVVNGNTVTPTLSILTAPLNPLPYPRITVWWTVISFALFVGILLLAMRLANRFQKPLWVLLPASLFLFTAAWRLHLYSGQIYIFYAFLMLAWYMCAAENKNWLAGLLAALLVAVRLPAALVILPWLLLNTNRKAQMAFITGGLLMVVLNVLGASVSNWQDYFYSMRLHGYELYGTIPTEPVQLALPATVEGISTQITGGMQQYGSRLSADILSLQKLLLQWGVTMPPLYFSMVFLATCTLLSWFIKGKRDLTTFSLPQLALAGFLLYMLAEYLVPAPRFTYNFVQWMLPVVIISTNGRFPQRLPRAALLLMTAGLLLNIFKIPFLPDCYSAGELLMFVAIVIMLKRKF